MGIIFGSVLFGPDSLQLQVLFVLSGVLILEAGVWGVTNGLLPNERYYLQLREEGDHFLGLIRILNEAAVARDNSDESDARFRDTRAQMHASVERMAEVAGKKDDSEEASKEVEAVVIEAAEAASVEDGAVVVEEEERAEETAASETAAEPAGRELDTAAPNA
jgi:hypothetical protein